MTCDGLDEQRPARSPDGKRVTFVSNRDNGCELYNVRLDAPPRP